ncbi:hypothetical protein ABPG72_015067 [Tetrahymena utriculariae]
MGIQQSNQQTQQNKNSYNMMKNLFEPQNGINNKEQQQNQALGQKNFNTNIQYQKNQYVNINGQSQQNQQFGNFQKPEQTKEKVIYIPKKQQQFEVNNQRGDRQIQSNNVQIKKQQRGEHYEQIQQNNSNKIFSNQSSQLKNLEDQIFLKMKEQNQKNKIIIQDEQLKQKKKNQNNVQNIQQQQQNPQADKQNNSDEYNKIKENQKLNEKDKQNTQNNKKHKHKEVENGFKDAFWICKECSAKNQWKHNKVCLTCYSNKYKSYDRMRKDNSQNDYQYLFFIDFECNNFNNTFEIIEFPLHVVDVTSKEVIESFVSYVKPSNKITNFITKLTKITNDHVQNAPILQQVLINVQNFLEKYLEAGIDKCAVVYDCDSDSSFLFSETSQKKIKVPAIFEKYICLKSVFPIEIAKKAPQSLQEMLQQLKIEFQGQQHCGADDCMNQARVGLKLLELGYSFSKDQEIKLGQSSTNISKEQQMKQYNMYKQEYLIQKQVK